MRILVVDDDPVILDLLPMILRQEGHEDISVAASGLAALDVLSCSDGVFDVLIFDICMPKMDGVALCAKVREIEAYRDTPIIMLTAKSDTRSIESAFGAGATDYITKPFDVKGVGVRIQVAERMMRESCRSCTITSDIVDSPTRMGTHEFGIDDPVRVTGIHRHTDPFSLGNYLSQLVRKKIDKTSVFAARINAFDALYKSCSSRELLVVIAEASLAISGSTGEKHLLNAYVGSGTFMCIVTDDVLTIWPEIEHRVCEYLKGSDALKTADLGAGISLAIGRPFRPNASKTKRVRQTFDRACSLLDRRLNANAKNN